MAESPRLFLGVETVKVGEEGSVRKLPLSAGVIGHAVVVAADVLVLVDTALGSAEGCSKL